MEDINNNLSENTQEQEQSQEQSQDINKNFGELSNSEQTDFIQKSFYGDDETEENTQENTSEKEQENKTENENKNEKEPEQEQTQENTTDNEIYTTEEFLLEDPLNINRDKLPEAAKLVHDKYMQFYNNQILPQLQELQNLRNNKIQNQTQDNSQDRLKQEQENFNNLVKQEAAKRLNLKSIDELDDFNSEHNIMLARVATQFEQVKNNQQSQQAYYQNNYNKAMQDLTQEFGSQEFAKIDAFALKDLEKLPYDLHQKVLSDLSSGNAETIKNIFRAFAERYKIANKKPEIKQQPVKEPPKVIAGSGNDSNIKRSWGIKDFTRGSGIDKARMLIDGGFLDD